MLKISDIRGNLKPEFEEYGDLIPLEPGNLNPDWWPWAVEGQEMDAAERHGYFNESHVCVILEQRQGGVWRRLRQRVVVSWRRFMGQTSRGYAIAEWERTVSRYRRPA